MYELNAASEIHPQNNGEKINFTRRDKVGTKLEDSHSRCPNGFPKVYHVLCDYSLSCDRNKERREAFKLK